MGMSVEMDMQLVINMYRKVEIHSAAIERQKYTVLNGQILSNKILSVEEYSDSPYFLHFACLTTGHCR